MCRKLLKFSIFRVKKKGVSKMRKLIKLPDDYLEQFFDLLQKSYSLKEIANELNISYAHIRRIVSRFYAQYEVAGLSELVRIKDKVISENSPKKNQ